MFGLSLTIRSTVVALCVLALCLACTTLCSAGDSSPIRELAGEVMASFPGADWELRSCDEQPGVKIGGSEGYRIVVRYVRREATNMPQMMTPGHKMEWAIMGYYHMDFVLFPSSQRLPRDAKTRIVWQKGERHEDALPAYMGEGRGYLWYTNGSAVWQGRLRERLGLSGGDDPTTLLKDWLRREGHSSEALRKAYYLVGQAGPKAIPLIKPIVQTDADPWYAVLSLARIPGEESTRLLQKYFHSGKGRISDAAAYALVGQPYRESAKKEYFELLRRGKYVESVCKACLQFGWKDAVPLLEKATENPPSWRDFRAAYETHRTLSGNPISRELLDVEQAITRSMPIFPRADGTPASDNITPEGAGLTLLGTQDFEAAAVISASLATYKTKASNDVVKSIRDIGIEVFSQLPDAKQEWIYRAMKALPENDPRLKELLDSLMAYDEVPQAVRDEQALARVMGYLGAAKAVGPESPEVKRFMAPAARHLCRHPELVAELFEKPEGSPDSPLSNSGLVFWLLDQGWNSEMIPYLEEALRTNTDRSSFHVGDGKTVNHYHIRRLLAKFMKERTGRPYTYTDADGTVRQAGELPR